MSGQTHATHKNHTETRTPLLHARRRDTEPPCFRLTANCCTRFKASFVTVWLEALQKFFEWTNQTLYPMSLASTTSGSLVSTKNSGQTWTQMARLQCLCSAGAGGHPWKATLCGEERKVLARVTEDEPRCLACAESWQPAQQKV